MNRNHSVPPLEPKRCLWCKGPMSERRPATFLFGLDQVVVGPFHAGCAERLRQEAWKKPDSNWLKGAAVYGHILPAREETLPW